MPEFALPKVVTPGPAVCVHVPVPVVAVFPLRVVVNPHTDWLAPTDAVVGLAIMVTGTSELHDPFVYLIVTVPGLPAVKVVPDIEPVPVPGTTLHVQAVNGVGETVSVRVLP